ncbi:hypothetical protein IH779_02945 [Patescibacteria group bacterium]|nr:hypothetical protein [Patescibacteria group bacterium]
MKNKTFVLLLAILLIASFFRLWQLDTIPPGLYPDEAINGNEALSNPWKVFYPENNGREGLFINLIFLSFSIFGISIWSLKIVPAVIGILTVLGLYLLTKEIFQNTLDSRRTSKRVVYKIQATSIALFSSFFLAISFWHINFSRIDFRAILLPLLSVFAFYFLFRGFRTKKIFYFIISGIFFGLGFHTYISYRFIVLLLPIVLISFWFIYQREGLQKQFLVFSFLLLVFTFIVALPIGVYFLQNPQDLVSRASHITVFAQDNPVKAFLVSFVSHLGMFNISGDFNWRHNFSGSPQFFWPIGILFLAGFIFSIKEFLKFFKTKNFTLYTSRLPEPAAQAAGGQAYFILLSWLFIMLLPGVLTYEGVPHALRVIGIIPAVYIFAGIGGWLLYEKIKQVIHNRKLFFVFCSLFLIFVTFAAFNKYFYSWAKNPNVEGAFTKKFVQIGNLLNSIPLDAQKYVIVNESGVLVPLLDGLPMPAQTVMFIESTKFGKPESIYLLPKDLDKIKIEKRTVIVPMKYDKDLLDELKMRFPGGEIQEKDGVWIYKIDS